MNAGGPELWRSFGRRDLTNPPKALHHFVKWGKYPPFGVLVNNTSRYFTHSLHFYLPLGGLLTNLVKYPKWGAFVNTGFVPFSEQKFQGLFRTFGDTFPISQGSIQCNKEPQVYVFFSSSTRAILSWRSFRVVGLDKVTTESQGLSRTDRNFQGLSRPWIFIFKFKDFQGAREPCQEKIVLRSCWNRSRHMVQLALQKTEGKRETYPHY